MTDTNSRATETAAERENKRYLEGLVGWSVGVLLAAGGVLAAVLGSVTFGEASPAIAAGMVGVAWGMYRIHTNEPRTVR